MICEQSPTEKPTVPDPLPASDETTNAEAAEAAQRKRKKALQALEEWTTLNTQLYGLILQCLPSNLRISVRNSFVNDGVVSRWCP